MLPQPSFFSLLKGNGCQRGELYLHQQSWWLQQWAQLPKDVSPSPLVSLLANSSLLSKSSQASCTIPLPSCTTMPFLFLAHSSNIPHGLFHLCLFAPWKDQLCSFLVVFARYLSNLKKNLSKAYWIQWVFDSRSELLDFPFSILLSTHILWIILSWPFLQYLLPQTHSLLVVECAQ